jgi:hypothetical protein
VDPVLVIVTYSPLRRTLLGLSLPGASYRMVLTVMTSVSAEAGSITAPVSTTAGRPTTSTPINFRLTRGSVGHPQPPGPQPNA